MATITPVLDTTLPVPRVIWEACATGDTLEPWIIKSQFGLAAAVQAVGTFGGATVTMQVSNDGTNWATLQDAEGGDVAGTAAFMHEFSTSAVYMRPALASGSANDIDVIMVMRGNA